MMTCIVGLIQDGQIYMGGDSAGSNGYTMRIYAEPKVFNNGPMIMGYTSSFRMGQLLQHCLEIPEHPDDMPDMTYMCSVFIDSIVELFKQKGYARVDNNEVKGGVFLVGYRGVLYRIESDYQVAAYRSDFAACGCGEEYALGVLEVTGDWIAPRNRIKMALRVAEKYSAGVSKPFKVIKQ